MAKEIIYLLNDNDIARLTAVSGNISQQYLHSYQNMAQISKLKPILGQKLYDKIENLVRDGDLADDYLKLYDDFIVDMLVYFSAYFLYSFHWAQVGNEGILLNSPDNKETISLLDVEKLAEKYLQLANSVELRFQSEKHKYDIPELQKDKGNDNSTFEFSWVF